MISFLAGLINSIAGDIKSVIRWITATIAAVFSYLDRLYHLIWTEVIGVYHAVNTLASEAWHYILVVYDFARSIVDVIIHDLIIWTLRIVTDAWNYADYVYHFILHWIDVILHYVDAAVLDLFRWVIKNVWNPLYNFVSGVIHWIEHEGAYLWDVITHPEKLAKLLGVWIWHAYLGLIKSAAKPIARWLLHTMLSLAGEFADVLEAIISALI